MIIETNNIDKIFNEIFHKELKLNTYSKIIAYKENNDIVGFCVYDLIYERIEIEYIGVSEAFRGQNIGYKLLKYIIDTYNLEISLEVNKNNEIAINLYKKLGFKVVTERKNYYNGEDAYLMIREV